MTHTPQKHARNKNCYKELGMLKRRLQILHVPSSSSLHDFLGSALGLKAEGQESWNILKSGAGETQTEEMMDFEGSRR
jgi:hypothetical protein